MISRRNIREKVMFVLYSIMPENENDSKTGNIPNAYKQLENEFENVSNNFLSSLLLITKIAQYAEIDAGHKAAKFLPTEKDKNVNVKIAGNTALWDLLENESFKNQIKDRNIEPLIPTDWIKKMYNKLTETDRYKAYINEAHRDKEQEKKILIYIWKNIALKDENFQDILMDEWNGYEQNRSTVRALVDFYFKDKQQPDFNQIISQEKIEFAEQLLKSVLEKRQHLNSIINPKLKNWDADRVALIDRILLLMGVSEFLYFPNIPKRVTINEYIEIGKEFSTDDSGRFINGILDSISKEIEKK